MEIIFLSVSFFASVVGSICGLGGGIIIKPALDVFGVYSVSAISFASGCIVLAMTAYSVLEFKLSGTSLIRKGSSTFLGIGGALGGVAGKNLFELIKALFQNANTVGAIQSALLFLVTLGTLLYTRKKDSVYTHHVERKLLCLFIGIALGVLSSFLGIGGGPINLMVLYFFFSMQTKEATQNSLYIILFSQMTSLGYLILSCNIPSFPASLLVSMVICGVLGGMAGRKISQRINDAAVNKLFMGLLCMIMLICCYNLYQFCSAE